VLLAAGDAFVDQPLLVAPSTVMAAAGAAKALRPARLEQIIPALLVRAEPGLEAGQGGRQIVRHHAMRSACSVSTLAKPLATSSLIVADS
jgi:hypothetical protein